MISDTFVPNENRFLSGISLQRVFFVLFLLTLPFSIRKVLHIFSADGVFNEYMDASVYLSDLLLVLTLLFYALENKSSILSIVRWRRMFHVEHLLLPIFVPLFLIVWAGLSIFWSESHILASVTFLKLAEAYLLYLYLLLSNVPRGTLHNASPTHNPKCSTWNINASDNIHGKSSQMFHVEHYKCNCNRSSPLNVPRGTFSMLFLNLLQKCSTWNIVQLVFIVFIISALFQSISAILQFIQQKSLGIIYLKESIFSVNDPGVAKIIINDTIFVRSYGFFPHPNILGGFLVVSLLMTIMYPLLFKRKMFHVEHFQSIWLYRIIIFVQLTALLLTFSKSALFAFIISLSIVIFSIKRMFHVEHLYENSKNVPRGTFENSIPVNNLKCSTWNIVKKWGVKMGKRMFHVEHLMIIVGILISIGILLSFNLWFFLAQPLAERLFYLKSLFVLSYAYFFQGVGIGQFVLMLQSFFDEKLLSWQFQPIHNVFLLIFSENGIVGLGLFSWFLVYAFRKSHQNVPRGTFSAKELSNDTECSTWSIQDSQGVNSEMFHVEHSQDSLINHSLMLNGGVILEIGLRAILVAVLIMMLFDHYFWDIQQGQLLFWLILALVVMKK